MSACEATTVGDGGERDHRVERPRRAPARRTGSSAAAGCARSERALAEVVEEERREDDDVPGRRIGPAAEVAHVGVERLAAGDAEDDASRARGSRARRCATKKRTAWRGSMASEEGRVGDDVRHAERRDGVRPSAVRPAAGSQQGEQALQAGLPGRRGARDPLPRPAAHVRDAAGRRVDAATHGPGVHGPRRREDDARSTRTTRRASARSRWSTRRSTSLARRGTIRGTN